MRGCALFAADSCAGVLIALSFLVRPVWITFLRYNFSVVAVFAVIYSKTAVNGERSLLKSYRNWPKAVGCYVTEEHQHDRRYNANRSTTTTTKTTTSDHHVQLPHQQLTTATIAATTITQKLQTSAVETSSTHSLGTEQLIKKDLSLSLLMAAVLSCSLPPA